MTAATQRMHKLMARAEADAKASAAWKIYIEEMRARHRQFVAEHPNHERDVALMKIRHAAEAGDAQRECQRDHDERRDGEPYQ